MFCVWRNNEDDWIKPAAGVGGSGGLFLTLSSDSSHGISKQSPKSQGAPATPREEKSLDNEENGNLRNQHRINIAQVMFVCGFGRKRLETDSNSQLFSRRSRSLSGVAGWHLLVRNVDNGDNSDGAWLLSITANNTPPVTAAGRLSRNFNWIRSTSNNCEVFIFIPNVWLTFELRQ